MKKLSILIIVALVAFATVSGAEEYALKIEVTGDNIGLMHNSIITQNSEFGDQQTKITVYANDKKYFIVEDLVFCPYNDHTYVWKDGHVKYVGGQVWCWQTVEINNEKVCARGINVSTLCGYYEELAIKRLMPIFEEWLSKKK